MHITESLHVLALLQLEEQAELKEGSFHVVGTTTENERRYVLKVRAQENMYTSSSLRCMTEDFCGYQYGQTRVRVLLVKEQVRFHHFPLENTTSCFISDWDHHMEWTFFIFSCA